MPFYSASLVETVQSDIASEKPGIFDVFREGAHRLLAFHVPQKGRMIPIWGLIGPSIALGVSKYVFGLVSRSTHHRRSLFTDLSMASFPFQISDKKHIDAIDSVSCAERAGATRRPA